MQWSACAVCVCGGGSSSACLYKQLCTSHSSLRASLKVRSGYYCSYIVHKTTRMTRIQARFDQFNCFDCAGDAWPGYFVYSACMQTDSHREKINGLETVNITGFIRISRNSSAIYIWRWGFVASPISVLHVFFFVFFWGGGEGVFSPLFFFCDRPQRKIASHWLLYTHNNNNNNNKQTITTHLRFNILT